MAHKTMQETPVGWTVVGLFYGLVAVALLVAVLLLARPQPQAGSVSQVVSPGVQVAPQTKSVHAWPHEFRRAPLYTASFDGLYAWPHEFARAGTPRNE